MNDVRVRVWGKSRSLRLPGTYKPRLGVYSARGTGKIQVQVNQFHCYLVLSRTTARQRGSNDLLALAVLDVDAQSQSRSPWTRSIRQSIRPMALCPRSPNRPEIYKGPLQSKKLRTQTGQTSTEARPWALLKGTGAQILSKNGQLANCGILKHMFVVA